MDKKTMMGIVREADCPKDYEKYYRFAHNYLLRLRSDEGSAALTDNQIKAKFGSAIKEIKRIIEANRRGTDLESLKKALGISGNNNHQTCPKWCQEVLDIMLKAPLATSEELDFIMGMCARKCKINSKGISLYLTDIKH